MGEDRDILREQAEEARYARARATRAAGGVVKSDELKRRNIQVQTPVLPAPVREPPEHFQALLTEFNRSTGEEIIVYFNPLAIPKVSAVQNLDGTRTILEGKDGRWELWRKIPDTIPAKAFERCQPCIIQELGVYTRLWTIMDNTQHVQCSVHTIKEGTRTLTATIGDYREPDERDIKQLRWCDTSRTPEGAADVMDEIFGQYNEKQSAAAQQEFDDLCADMASYYWNMPNPIVPVGGGAKNQKADWRTAQGMER
jgi:hypothetical protein